MWTTNRRRLLMNTARPRDCRGSHIQSLMTAKSRQAAGAVPCKRIRLCRSHRCLSLSPPSLYYSSSTMEISVLMIRSRAYCQNSPWAAPTRTRLPSECYCPTPLGFHSRLSCPKLARIPRAWPTSLTSRYQAHPVQPHTYSNLNYRTLARLVEVVTGTPFDQYLEEKIFT